MTNYVGGVHDNYRAQLVEARNSPAVLKTKLAVLRSHQADVVVLAFEGVDDKLIYAQWVKRTRPELVYEPFLCDGKAGVLALVEIMRRDVGGDTNRVYCFLDRDFDDLRGTSGHPRLFMTHCYSPENLLATSEVLENLLMNEFNCHGEKAVRQRIIGQFESAYSAFLSASKDANWRLFVARRLGIKLPKSLPDKLNSIFSVTLEGVIATGASASSIVEFEPQADQVNDLSAEFELLNPKVRYRGKWAFVFFEAWLRLLESEYRNSESAVFEGINRRVRVRSSGINMTNLASKSALPVGLALFVGAIA